MRISLGNRTLKFASEAEIPEELARVARARGHTVSIASDGQLRPGDADAVLIMGNLNWFRTTLRQIRALPAKRRPLLAVWHYEPLPPSRASGLPRPRLHWREIAKILLRDARSTDVYSNARRIAREWARGDLRLVMVSAPGRREFLTEQGIPAEWVPVGYTAADGRDLNRPRDIDVLFLGAMDVPRRRQLIGQLRGAGLRVEVAGDWNDPAYWGERRTELLNRTKVLLNLARTAGEYSGMRLIRGMANKALVASEPIYLPAPFVPGEHFLMEPIDRLADGIRHYLSNDEARTAMVERAHRFVIEEHTMERSAGNALRLLEGAKA